MCTPVTGVCTGGVDPCIQCEQTNTDSGTCFNTVADGATAFGCDGFTGTDKTLCTDLLACIRTSNGTGHTCAVSDDPTPCLCGTLTATQCIQADPATLPGVCRDKYIAAAKGGNVLSLFFATNSPIGIANNLLTCDIDVPCACGQ
jgi:hypothetical protein